MYLLFSRNYHIATVFSYGLSKTFERQETLGMRMGQIDLFLDYPRLIATSTKKVVFFESPVYLE